MSVAIIYANMTTPSSGAPSKQAKNFQKKYHQSIEDFSRAFNKEHASAKRDGNVDEQEADPITAALFRRLCQWAIFENNVFVWVFAILQWNLMSRTANIDALAIHNMRRGKSDSITFSHDKTKADQGGQFTTEKNVYANPLEPEVDCFLALGIWLSLNQS